MAVALQLAGCGGSDDRATVEAGLRQYLSTLVPEGSGFPVGAGVPHVKDNGCKDLHRKLDPRDLPGWTEDETVKRFAIWQCVVGFRSLELPVAVAVDDTRKVVWAWPGGSANATRLSPARTYTG